MYFSSLEVRVRDRVRDRVKNRVRDSVKDRFRVKNRVQNRNSLHSPPLIIVFLLVQCPYQKTLL